MLSLLLLLAAPDSVSGMMQAYHEKTQVEPHCRAAQGDEVLVCGRRAADRYRVPFVASDPGDPAHEAVPAERERLLARTNNCQEKSAFLVGCGSAGVRASTSFGRDGIGTPHLRPMAQ